MYLRPMRFFINTIPLRNLPIVILLFAAIPSVPAQETKEHRWKKRLIVVYAPKADDPSYLKQLEQLRDSVPELEERQVLVYRILPGEFTTGLEGANWKPRDAGTFAGVQPEDGFGVLLIGLDGGIKLQSDTVVSADRFWALIDAMPMRRAELRNKG